MVVIYERHPSNPLSIRRAQQEYQDSLLQLTQIQQSNDERFQFDQQDGSSLKTIYSETQTRAVNAEKHLGGFHEFWKSTNLNYDDSSPNIEATYRQVQKLVEHMSQPTSLTSVVVVSPAASQVYDEHDSDQFDDSVVSMELNSSFAEGFEMRRERPENNNEDLSSIVSVEPLSSARETQRAGRNIQRRSSKASSQRPSTGFISSPKLVHSKHTSKHDLSGYLLTAKSNARTTARTKSCTIKAAGATSSVGGQPKPASENHLLINRNRSKSTRQNAVVVRPRYLDIYKSDVEKPQAATNKPTSLAQNRKSTRPVSKPKFAEVTIPVVSIEL